MTSWMYGERQFFCNGCWDILTDAEEVGGVDLGSFLSDPCTDGAAPSINDTRNTTTRMVTNASVTTFNYKNPWDEGDYY